MSTLLKTHLAVHGGGRTMIEKMIDWETHIQLSIHSNARVGLQRITFQKQSFADVLQNRCS